MGNVFGYAPGRASEASDSRPWKAFDSEYDVFWRDENAVAAGPANHLPAAPSRDAAIWPEELQRNDYFRRRGKYEDEHPQMGDFGSHKELVTEYLDTTHWRFPVRDILIRAYEYMMARYDFDGYRIDALKHVEPDFARVFGNAMREYALSIGKRNFFTFGEVAGADDKLMAEFVGRDTPVKGQSGATEGIGIDAALDFPLYGCLPGYAKARGPGPGALVGLYRSRKEAQDQRITSHGEAGQYFVTFLDNHDNHDYRFSPFDPGGFDSYFHQFSLGLGCLLALQGIPCIYYGTEQGLPGLGKEGDLGVREALWGKPGAFDEKSKHYLALKALLACRAREAPLRYGRQYFRPVSGDGNEFSISPYPDGVLAFSRVLRNREILIVANPNPRSRQSVRVVVDAALNPQASSYIILYTNQPGASAAPGPVVVKQGPQVVVNEPDGRRNQGGPVTSVLVHLNPMEIQILSR